MSTEREALVGMVALWESMFDAEHRCSCLHFADGPLVHGKIEHGVLTKTDVTFEDRPPTTCAYCTAKAVLEHGRLAMDEQRVGRT